MSQERQLQINERKILCITNDFGPRAGGIETFVIGLIERMPRGQVVVYTSSQQASAAFDQRWLTEYGVKVIRDRSKILLPTLRVGRSVRRVAKNIGAESVFFGAAAPLGLLARGLRKCGVKQIVALTHGHEVWWARVWPFSVAIKQIGRHTNHLTYLGGFTQNAIARSLTTDAVNRMVKIAPGIDTEHFRPTDATDLRLTLGITDKKVIVSVGRLVHRKGQDKLIQALPEIMQKVPNAHLLLIGEGPYRIHLEKLVAKLNLSQNISFIGRIKYSDLPVYICAGDIFAMPSRSRLAGLEVEGLGIVYLEASSCGLSVVGGLSGGAPDAVIEGVTGYSIDGRSQHAVATACIALLNNPDLAHSMGAAGRDWIVGQWGWPLWSSRFSALLNPDH